MKNLWDDKTASRCEDELALRVYSSRLLGSNSNLVLHGGGNTSVKIRETNLVGEEEEILYVKGSGWDLATIEAAGFTPIRMAHLLKLAQLKSLSDLDMVNELKTQQTIASAPTGSVEAILHATLPFKYVDHTHADAIVTITNTANGEARIRQIYGDDLVIIPYVMPGFDLARLVAERYAAEAHGNTIGMVLMNHGIFSFADDAKTSYQRMIDLVQRAEDYLQAEGAWQLEESSTTPITGHHQQERAELRKHLSKIAGAPCLLSYHSTPSDLSFCQRDDISTISQQGPATPDHVIRTKRLPLLGRDVERYQTFYKEDFEKNAPPGVTMLNPAPRVILDAELGMISVGKSAKECGIIADIYHHTMQIIQRAEKLGGWQALPASKVLEVEYWELEQAKLRKSGSAPKFQGEVALVTGAASGIGSACVEALLARGAAVVGIDIDPTICKRHPRADFLGLQCDVTNTQQLEAVLEATTAHFGGLDMLILNAGMFPGGNRIEKQPDDLWRKVMDVNLDANMRLMRSAHPLLKEAPAGGRVVVIGSKNVPAPGPGAAAYSASKAALNQLARIAALEWGGDNIRINSLHPDAVFDTGIWSDEILQSRASHYGMSVEAYKTKNILQTEITSHDVAELAAEMCGPLFAKTTGAQLPIDGGNERVI
jgi:rhamnose utilization protein RhaD (predicted bifunctional aldolase and dehydrogenase)/NAD(P)-dependent dehydrogenase (short-subunit alcohol dehydrogenase family)